MKDIQIYTTKFCGFCVQAKRLLERIDLNYTEHPVDNNPELRRDISQKAGNYRTVPMIFIDDQFIGGYMELADLVRSGKLP